MHILLPFCLTILMLTNSLSAADPTSVYEELTIKYTGGEYNDEIFKYRLLKPAKIDDGKKYPVVMFLHGAGERGDDNKSQLKYFPTWMAEDKNREKYPCFIIAPQCRTGNAGPKSIGPSSKAMPWHPNLVRKWPWR